MVNKYDSIVEKLGAQYLGSSRKRTVSETEFLQLEKAFGIALPADYREFMRDHSGLDFYTVGFPLLPNPDPLHTRSLSALYFAGAEENGEFVNSFEDMSWEAEYMSGIHLVKEMDVGVETIVWPKELLEIGFTPSGMPICMAVGGLRPGAIFLVFLNCSFEQGIYLVSNSFDEFMQSLFIES